MITLLRAACVLAVLATTACGSRSAGENGQQAASSEPVVYVDVRTPEEYASGHVAGSILIPHDQMEARWEELAQHKDKPIVLYCRTGRRSGLALDVLKEKGFTNVKNGGGFNDLAARGVPTAR